MLPIDRYYNKFLIVLSMNRSLDMLVDVNLAEEGILRLLFTAVYQMLHKVGNDSEVALTSRYSFSS